MVGIPKRYTRHLSEVDSDISEAIKNEEKRQNNNLQLIASENHTSLAVREAVASVMTDKYAEGYPHKRYYGGCDFVDLAEDLAIERAKKLFGADHVNVQAHSGSQANMAVCFTVLKPGDTILGMDLSHGGHLSHGHFLSFSGQLYNAGFYQVNKETEKLDYSEVSAIARKTKPNLIICGASAYPRTIDFKAFREISDDVGAVLLADVAHIAGLIAAKEHPSPVPYADFITTTTHKTLRGPRGAIVMCKQEHAKALDKAVFPGAQGGPFMNVIAGKAVCFKEAQTSEWRNYQKSIVKNAAALADALIAEDFKLVSGGTDNHLMLVNLIEKGLTGKEAEGLLAECGITLNKNTIPFDPQKPFIASGIRIGTPCVTSRDMAEAEMTEIASLISKALSGAAKEEVKSSVSELCSRFPLYELK